MKAIIVLSILLSVTSTFAKSVETVKSEKKVVEEKKQEKRGLDSWSGVYGFGSPWDAPAPLVVEKHIPFEKHIVHKEIVPVHTHSVKHVPIYKKEFVPVVKKEYVPYPVEKHVPVHVPYPVKEYVPIEKHIVHKEYVPYPKPVVVEKSPIVYKSYSSWPHYSSYSDWHHY